MTSANLYHRLSIEMEVPSHESTRYLPDSWVVRFEKGKEQVEEEIQKHSSQLINIDNRVPIAEVELDKKLKLFIDIFRALAGENRYDVKKETLIEELVNTGKYTEQEALVYIMQAQQYGFIFERRIGMYALA